jgi:hypothetical protein
MVDKIKHIFIVLGLATKSVFQHWKKKTFLHNIHRLACSLGHRTITQRVHALRRHCLSILSIYKTTDLKDKSCDGKSITLMWHYSCSSRKKNKYVITQFRSNSNGCLIHVWTLWTMYELIFQDILIFWRKHQLSYQICFYRDFVHDAWKVRTW